MIVSHVRLRSHFTRTEQSTGGQEGPQKAQEMKQPVGFDSQTGRHQFTGHCPLLAVRPMISESPIFKNFFMNDDGFQTDV